MQNDAVRFAHGTARDMSGSNPQAPSRRDIALLILALLSLKGLVLLLDPTVRLFMGDSVSYLHAAYADWVPADRSYTYPLFIRLVAVSAHSLQPLLIAQTFLGLCTALIVFRILQGVFALDARIAGAIAVLFSIGSEQLFYERMVMAETISLFALAGMLGSGLAYMRGGNPLWLLAQTVAGILAVSYRLSLLPVVLGFALLPPIIRALLDGRGRPRLRLAALASVVIAAALTVGTHSAYKSWVGYLSDTKPGYAASAGMLRLGLVLPLVQDEDLEGLDLPVDFLDRLPPGWDAPGNRESALWSENGIVAKLRDRLGDDGMARAARKISIRALRRDPLGLLRLSWLTLGGYFDPAIARYRMRDDLGERAPHAEAAQMLRDRYSYESSGVSELRSLSSVYFGASRTWFTFCLFCLPLLALVSIGVGWRSRQAALLLLGLVSLGMFFGHALFSSIVSFRYLHAFPMLALLNAGALAAWLRQRSSGTAMPVDPELG